MGTWCKVFNVCRWMRGGVTKIEQVQARAEERIQILVILRERNNWMPLALFPCCFILHFFRVKLVSCCTFVILHLFYVALFPFCTFFVLALYMFHFLCCFVLHSCHVALFLCWILKLNFFQVTLFLCFPFFIMQCFHLELFSWRTHSCCTFFRVALFSRCIIFFVLDFFHTAPFFVVYSFHVVPFFYFGLFSCTTFFLLHIFSCRILSMLHVFQFGVPLLTYFLCSCFLVSFFAAAFSHTALFSSLVALISCRFFLN